MKTNLESSFLSYISKYTSIFISFVVNLVSINYYYVNKNIIILIGSLSTIIFAIPIFVDATPAKIIDDELYLQYLWNWVKIKGYKNAKYFSGSGDGGFAFVRLEIPENKLFKSVIIPMITEKDMEIYEFLKTKTGNSIPQ
jgi:hypothetical protein